MQLPIYLDYQATTPVDPRVTEKMIACLEINGNFGNPASQGHVYGWRAAEAVEKARQQTADLINADPREIIWTSGATEAINLALKGTAYFYQRKGKHIVTFASEHKAVLDTCAALAKSGFELTILKPKPNGLIDLDMFTQCLRPETILVSILHVNNEIGVIQDLQSISQLTRSKGIVLHVDAAQSAGKIPIDVRQTAIDLLSMSAHKIYGPKGIGALFVSRHPRIRLAAQIHGGGHEQGLRSGTLATHQIVGMGEACHLAKLEMLAENQRIQLLSDKLRLGLQQLPQIYMNGDLKQRIASNLNISFAGVNGEALLLALKDIAVSSGAACTSATIEPSHVLTALGCSRELAHSAIRFSLGRFTTTEEIDYTIHHCLQQVTRLREMSPLFNV